MILVIFWPARAEFRRVHRFRNVDIPFRLKYEGGVLARDQYDFEIIADRTLNMFKLRIAKKGKYLCLIDGEILISEAPGARGEKMEEVPDEPTLTLSRIPDKNVVDIIVETGKIIRLFPYHRIRFQMECE